MFDSLCHCIFHTTAQVVIVPKGCSTKLNDVVIHGMKSRKSSRALPLNLKASRKAGSQLCDIGAFEETWFDLVATPCFQLACCERSRLEVMLVSRRECSSQTRVETSRLDLALTKKISSLSSPTQFASDVFSHSYKCYHAIEMAWDKIWPRFDATLPATSRKLDWTSS